MLLLNKNVPIFSINQIDYVFKMISKKKKKTNTVLNIQDICDWTSGIKTPFLELTCSRLQLNNFETAIDI